MARHLLQACLINRSILLTSRGWDSFESGSLQVDSIVVAMKEELQEQAFKVARTLRSQGQTVDLVLQVKKMKQVFKVMHSS